MTHISKWAVIAGFIVLVAGFFYQTLANGRLPVPADTLVGLYHPWRDQYAGEYPRGVPYKNFLITDPIRQQIPWRKVVIDAWKRGAVPTYNPYAFLGVPLDANIQAAPFYPLNVLFFLMEFPTAWSVLIMLQPLLAALFFFWYIRNLKLSQAASALGAITWGFSGFSVSWLTWGTIVHTAVWLPLILLSIDKLEQGKHYARRPLPWAALLVFSVVMTIFGGHLQVALYTLMFSVVYYLWRYRPLAALMFRRPVAWCFIGALGIASIQWVPFMRYLWDSGRIGAVETWKNDGWFLPWQHLVQFVAPDFFGNPATLNYWGVWNYGEFIGYIGVIPLILALSALRGKGVARLFVVTGFFSLLFMTPNIISRMPFELHIPVLSVLQPTRLMVLVDFSLAILAVYGLDMLRKGERKHLAYSIAGFGAILTLLWIVTLGGRFFGADESILAHLVIAKRNLFLPTILYAASLAWLFVYRSVRMPRTKHVVLWALFVIVVFDLFRFGWKFTPFTPVSYFFPETEIIRYLKNQKKPFRVMSLDDRILPSNVSAYFGIETIEGYDPIAPSLYEDYMVSSERGKYDTKRPTGFNRIYRAHNIDSPLLAYMNVTHVLSLTDIDRPFLRLLMKEGETRLYAYTRALPRAYLSAQSSRAFRQEDALAGLFEERTGPTDIYEGRVEVMNVPPLSDETVEIAAYGADTMRIRTTTINNRLLVILNRFDPRWRVVMDGKTVLPVLRVNYLFMGVVVPQGAHDIILSYR